MANMNDIYETYNKTVDIIDSCTNDVQLKNAANYVDLFIEFVKNFEGKDLYTFSYYNTERYKLLWEMKHTVESLLCEKKFD